MMPNAARLAAAKRPVYVVTTQGGKHLFGLHRNNARGVSTSYVLGFHENAHALALAKGLEAYRRSHGHFPPRDLTVEDMGLRSQNVEAVEAFSFVAVDAMGLTELAEKLSGTGIQLSLLTPVGKESEWTFRWTDIDCNRRAATTVQRLNDLMRHTAAPAARARAGLPARGKVPALAPKPAWPPAKKPWEHNGGMRDRDAADPPPRPRSLLSLAFWELLRRGLRVGVGLVALVSALVRSPA